MEKEKLVRIFDKQAMQYDRRREGSNQGEWRKSLLSCAKGEVLELAVGAGANFPFYPLDVKVTATDFSEEMLKKARQAAEKYRIEGNFICSDIEELQFADHSFNTIVSTLSFCSYKQPLMVLDRIKRWCRPEGSILFMEHGISSNLAISTAQKILNPLLYRVYGCHHTRNIPELIRTAGLTIDRVESHWMNMVHVIWAKP